MDTFTKMAPDHDLVFICIVLHFNFKDIGAALYTLAQIMLYLDLAHRKMFTLFTTKHFICLTLTDPFGNTGLITFTPATTFHISHGKKPSLSSSFD